MKTLKIPKSFRHSAIEYFDSLVNSGRVALFFVGKIDETGRFPLAYEVEDEQDDVVVCHLNAYAAEHELEFSKVTKVSQIEALDAALSAISPWQQNAAIETIMEYCDINLNMVDFEDDGRFQIESELEWNN